MISPLVDGNCRGGGGATDDDATRPALVICRELAGLRWLKRNIARLGGRVVVASDDLQVQKRVANWPGVVAVSFIEQPESFYNVAGQVMVTISRINAWLLRVGELAAISQPLLFWAEYCEGGDTSQRIQDGLLLIRSYEKLLELHRPKAVWILHSALATWEDDLLGTCAQNAGIVVQRAGNLRLRDRWRRWWRYWRPLAKEVYFSGSVVMAKLRRFSEPGISVQADKAVAIQLCDSAKKHLNHTLPLLHALDQAGLEGVALCWGAGNVARALREQGLRAVTIEGWVTWRALVGSWWSTWTIWRQALAARDLFLQEGHPHELMLRAALWDSMRIFFQLDFARRARMYAALQRYWTKHPARAARLWTRVLWQGVVAYRALKAIKSSPLLFWQPGWPYQVPDPYPRREEVPVDYIYAISEAHVEQLHRDKGIPTSAMVVVGLFWMERVQAFKRQFSRADSRRMLGIPSETELCVLVEPSYFSRGYMASAEQVTMLQTALTFACAHPAVRLLIKPHPSHKPGALEMMVNEAHAPNVMVIPQADLPYHALNAADVLVTKYSTLAVEGMVLGVPAIGIILDGEKQFACYENAVDYVWDAAALQDKLQRLLDSRDYRAAWTEDLACKSRAFLARHTFEGDGSASERIARHLKPRLS
jgi:hypothetical protein